MNEQPVPEPALSKEQLKGLLLSFLDLLAKNPPPKPAPESEAQLPDEPPEE